MPARLVYAPKAYVYTKNQDDVLFNLSPWVVKGQVQRKINQVSTAEVVLRNPYKQFTTPRGGSVAFHPMDPITIYLERIRGFPVRVFTGYLDTTPYYQLYPGVITLQASCTLKRLLYTYFDPALPYVIAFFQKYGWFNTGTGSIISTQALNGEQTTTLAAVNTGAQPFTDLKDGSLGNLLWATLFDIGEWKDEHIYIENLPTGANGIAKRMATLMQNIDAGQKQASDDLTTFLSKIIGSGNFGSGGGPGAGSGGGGGSGSGKPTGSYQGLVSPFTKKYTANLGNTDQGVDFGRQQGINTGDPILAIGDCYCRSATQFYVGSINPQALWFEFTPTGKQASGYWGWYIAEEFDPKISPGPALVKAGTIVGTYAASGTGIEIGWAAADGETATRAFHPGEIASRHDGNGTTDGRSFLAFLQHVGAI